MKMFFEDYNLKEDFDESTFRSDVYNALADIAFKYEGTLLTEDDFTRAFEWFLFHFFEDEYPDELKEAKVLSDTKGTIAKLFKDNADDLMKITSLSELKNRVIKLLNDNHIDTENSRRMIKVEIPSIKTLSSMQKYVYDKILAGDGYKVI